MFQAIFGGGFNPNKTKTQLRLCVSRIKLLQNKKNVLIRQQRKDIATLLANGKEDSARIRVEALIQEQGCSIAYEILELYCELLSVRVELMKQNKVSLCNPSLLLTLNITPTRERERQRCEKEEEEEMARGLVSTF